MGHKGVARFTLDRLCLADIAMPDMMTPGFAAIRPQDSCAPADWFRTLITGRNLIEEWHCDLSTGLFSFGAKTRTRHGLADDCSGLIDLIRGYAASDRQTVLGILEEATATPSCFCYCTTITAAGGMPESRVYCVGMSEISSTAGRLHGIFAYPPLDG